MSKFDPDLVLEYLDLVASGVGFKTAGEVLGVGDVTGARWWRRSVPVDLVEVGPQKGGRGGLPGPVPLRDPVGVLAVDGPRQRRQLSVQDRAVIAAGLTRRMSYAEIGRLIGRDRSVVWREVARNTGGNGVYTEPVAHRAAHQRRRRPREFVLATNPGLCRRIEDWMDQGWSPKLIATMLKADQTAARREAGQEAVQGGCPEDGGGHLMMDRVSHETIYQALYVQTRGGLRADLHRELSLRRRARKPGGSTENRGRRYAEAFKIAQRPAEVADRAVPGHWEGDLIMGPGNVSAIGTLVERSTRFVILLHLPGRHDADSVAAAMIREMSQLPDHLRRSITWDRGIEMMRYDRIQVALGTQVYFCDPHSPWQRGTNENTNRLLRHWFEKGTDLSVHSAADLRRIAATLNRRPRPTLDLETPADRLDKLLTQAA